MPRWLPSQFALLLKTFLEVNDVLAAAGHASQGQ